MARDPAAYSVDVDNPIGLIDTQQDLIAQIRKDMLRKQYIISLFSTLAVAKSM